jgi:hypothetical protein
MRLERDLTVAAIRGDMKREIVAHNRAASRLASWIRNIWARRQRWLRNRVVATDKRKAAQTIKRFAVGFVARCVHPCCARVVSVLEE